MSAISGTSTIAERPAASVGLDGSQVDLGLARAGHSLQEESLGRRMLVGESFPKRFTRRVLIGGERRRVRRGGADGMPGGAPRPRAALERHQPAGLQATQGARPQLDRRGRTGVPQRGQQAALAVGQPDLGVAQGRFAGSGELGDEHAAGSGPARCPGGEHQRERPGGSRAVLAGHPVGQRHEIRAQAGADDRLGLGQPLRLELGVFGQFDDDAERALGPERHPQQRAHDDV